MSSPGSLSTREAYGWYSAYVPDLDFALIAEYVKLEQGLAHVVAGGMDTIRTTDMPIGHNIGLLLRISFDRFECNRPHRVEVIVQDEDGGRLVGLTATGKPLWRNEWPVTWKSSQAFAFNLSLPLKRPGVHEFKILVNDSLMKTIPFLVIHALPDMPETQSLPE